MKKRILALALAGTTAFSVFGAAMSANAVTYWRGDSTHVSSDDGDYYVEYKPAGLIHWTAEEVQVDLANPSQAVYTTTSYEAVDHEDGAYIPSGTTLYLSNPVDFNGDD